MQDLTPETRVQIAPYMPVTAVRKVEDLYEIDVLADRDQDYVTTLTVDEDALRLFKSLMRPRAIDDAALETSVSTDEALSFCRDLFAQGILTTTDYDAAELLRYNRHLLFYDLIGNNSRSVQHRLSDKRVAICGVGGIGNWVTSGLIGMGLRELRLFDFDKVELTNLTRQILFTESDIGKPKIDVAANRLRLMNSETEITTVSCANEEHVLMDNLDGIDLLVLSADRPLEIHDWVDDVCIKLNIPYLNAGYTGARGVLGPLVQHGRTACYQCFKPRAARGETVELDAHEDIVLRAQAPSFGPINALVSSVAVLEMVKFLGGFGSVVSLGTRLIVDSLELTWAYIALLRDPKCWHCSHLSYALTLPQFRQDERSSST